jgi:hypothetical protein
LLQELNEVLIFEARNVSKAGVLGIYAEDILQCLVEERYAKQHKHYFKGLGSKRSPAEVVWCTRGRQEQRTFLQAARDPRPVALALLCLSLTRTNPYNQWLRYCRHGKNL